MVDRFLKVFSVLSDINRFRIYTTLLQSTDGFCVCELSLLLNLPFYTVSKGLKELENILLLEKRRKGQYIFYFPKKTDDPFISKLNSFIIEIANSSNMINIEEINKVLSERDIIKCYK
ncbi:MAG TPA: hypothetical protein PKW55_08235 [Spirochaetota bacterium]|nr:hypothetical protein [Spirochaetota bacterium]HOM39063.1 hypothetical protein [Spirochaetota bacterium]HPQ49969.1 hypothetical protein [Spirochaetota bacterium]